MKIHVREFICDEEHSSVLQRWQDLGLRDAVVICLDRHLDLKRIRDLRLNLRSGASSALSALCKPLPVIDSNAFSYGADDFLYFAGHLSITSAVVWIMPDDLAFAHRHGVAGVLWDNVSQIPGHGKEIASTFENHDSTAQCVVNGMRIWATTLRSIPMDLKKERLHIDIDLDFFACNSLAQVHEQLERASCKLTDLSLNSGNIITGCYSSLSGYLPESLRFVGAALSNALHWKFSPQPFPECLDLDIWKWVVDCRTVSSYDIDCARDSPFIQRLRGAGQSILASVSVKSGLRSQAESFWTEASLFGDHATWPAYQIALDYLREKNYLAARLWFDRVAYDIADKLQVSAAILSAICCFRLCDLEVAWERCVQIIDEVPLEEDAYDIATAIATTLHDSERLDLIEGAHAELRRLKWDKCLMP